ncbi:helix-turn-helix domain-containing protein [Sphingobium sp. HWE2-09]|uniref:helix-turn-helix domain-containing protein n=1 Tax=Sphingobium sp. HWE2-09 TaxID=3108390 RepID=UPI002DD2F6DB|nr:helix-turn-helix domain-containing protein [Sphingobium sp. HWE2-09]
MKKVTPNGNLIKELRSQLEKGSLQKEMSHAVGISERRIRSIENENAAVTMPELDRIAAYLGVPRDTIAYAIDTPKLVPAPNDTAPSLLDRIFKDRVIPRFDKDLAYATMDEGRLIHDAQHSQDLTVQIDVQLTAETSEYAEELIRLLTDLTYSKRDWLSRPTPADEIALRRRVRQLLVLLKGNDVWFYYTHQMRHLPERYDLPAEGDPSEMQFRIASVLGPPGEYGEESTDVNVDNGQPYFMKGWEPKKQGENEGC